MDEWIHGWSMNMCQAGDPSFLFLLLPIRSEKSSTARDTHRHTHLHPPTDTHDKYARRTIRRDLCVESEP